MKKTLNIIGIILITTFFIAGCGQEQSETATDNNKSTGEPSSGVNNVDEDKQNLKLVNMEIKCEGMTCTGCEKTIEKSVMALNGMKNVKADHEKKIVKVEYVEGALSAEDIENAITEVGYKVIKN
ncbi:MAG: cation transporter [Ignavibacteriaceae bacterium]|jgi:Copper chaperone|nr:MAG: copper chaperone [Chlorobiota bacterium]KXK03230.1 MAG: Copper chaperone CopZ [Chlorobi bacterium OLB4]MBV6399687.1 hypothetical protein [Ignavibacteria bacterium]MCC6885679.1 heavy-metal-associated domain-containing protein [Ignavibacteriales bacterium]MCE7953843.1 copper chaperone [Chlorobi bacterium CHB7]MDL1887777.1 heavy-metal-associated domain-containing protein [Ignavibacteria bacterium CHB1]MEB2330399.1 cation transporter [Ignavibacteriaceae bacterium]OQY76890.1 MAG: hypothet